MKVWANLKQALGWDVPYPPMPELQTLPHKGQIKVWRVCRREATGLIERSALSLVFFVTYVLPWFVLDYFDTHPGAFAAWFGLAIAIASGLWAYVKKAMPRRLRSALITYCVGNRLPACSMCDYDLRATTSDTCPECGAPIRVKLPEESE